MASRKLRCTVLSVLVTAATVLLTLAAGVAAERATGAAGAGVALPGSTIPDGIGLNVHLTGPESEWDRIKQAGVSFVRTDFPWEAVERTKGQYDFARYDRMLDALDARAMRVVFIL